MAKAGVRVVRALMTMWPGYSWVKSLETILGLCFDNRASCTLLHAQTLNQATTTKVGGHLGISLFVCSQHSFRLYDLQLQETTTCIANGWWPRRELYQYINVIKRKMIARVALDAQNHATWKVGSRVLRFHQCELPFFLCDRV